MSQALSASQSAQLARSGYRNCLLALLHPSITTYQMLGQQRASVWHAYMLMFASSLIGSMIESLAPIGSQLVAQGSLDALLLAMIPIAALIAVCSLVAFAWCAHIVARSFKGSGSYAQLTYVCGSNQRTAADRCQHSGSDTGGPHFTCRLLSLLACAVCYIHPRGERAIMGEDDSDNAFGAAAAGLWFGWGLLSW